MSVTGRIYLERGEPVTVLAQWSRSPATVGLDVDWLWPPKVNGPRNVLIERADGSREVRPFRGLRSTGQPSVTARGTVVPGGAGR